MKNNLELSISRSNFDPYFQMHATGQTRRTQSTTDTTAVVHFLWHRWAGMLKMSVSYTQLCQTSLQMDILTDLRQMFERNRRLKCEKKTLLLSTVMTIAVKAGTLCVLTFRGGLHIPSHTLFSETREQLCYVVDRYILSLLWIRLKN